MTNEKNWVELNDAKKSLDVDESDSDIFTAGVDIPGWFHKIECHGDTELEAIKLRDLVFSALSKYSANIGDLSSVEPFAEIINEH